jgi:hypothetical protein
MGPQQEVAANGGGDADEDENHYEVLAFNHTVVTPPMSPDNWSARDSDGSFSNSNNTELRSSSRRIELGNEIDRRRGGDGLPDPPVGKFCLFRIEASSDRPISERKCKLPLWMLLTAGVLFALAAGTTVFVAIGLHSGWNL